MVTDTGYSAFSFRVSPVTTFAVPVLYAASGASEAQIVDDTFNMVPMGRFGTPSPGGVALAYRDRGQQPGHSTSAQHGDGKHLGRALVHGAASSQQAGAPGRRDRRVQLILSENDPGRVPARGGHLLARAPIGITWASARPGYSSSLDPGLPLLQPVAGVDTIVCALNAGERGGLHRAQRLNQARPSIRPPA
jgi:hypothetical protein